MSRRRTHRKSWTLFHIIFGLMTGGLWWIVLLIYRTAR